MFTFMSYILQDYLNGRDLFSYTTKMHFSLLHCWWQCGTGVCPLWSCCCCFFFSSILWLATILWGKILNWKYFCHQLFMHYYSKPFMFAWNNSWYSYIFLKINLFSAIKMSWLGTAVCLVPSTHMAVYKQL